MQIINILKDEPAPWQRQAHWIQRSCPASQLWQGFAYLWINTGKIGSFSHEGVGAMKEHYAAICKHWILQNCPQMKGICEFKLQVFISKSDIEIITTKSLSTEEQVNLQQQPMSLKNVLSFTTRCTCEWNLLLQSVRWILVENLRKARNLFIDTPPSSETNDGCIYQCSAVWFYNDVRTDNFVKYPILRRN